mgnify:CR=1 FL=1
MLRAALYLAALAVLVLFGSAGCETPEARIVGGECLTQDDCEGLSSGYCAQGGFCTRTCGVHSDCGCDDSTTDVDIQDGGCWARCMVDGQAPDGVCMRACGEDDDCEAVLSCAFSPNEVVGSCL